MNGRSSDIDELPAGLVLVDLSNIARDASFGFSANAGSLTRWDRVRGAWTARFGEPSEGFVVVADESLFRFLSAADARRLEDLERDGRASIVGHADDEILDRLRAADGAATILSNDRFRDLMKRPEARSADVRHVIVRDGNVAFEKRANIRLFSAQVTSLADAKELDRLGLTEASAELKYRWWCRTPGCQSDAVVFPDVRSGSARCDRCDAYLERGEAWRHPAWVKILVRPEGDREFVEVDRFVLEDSDVVTLGRGPEYRPGHRLGDFVPADQLSSVSRRHLQLENIMGTIEIEDLDTTNGTSVLTALPNRNWLPARRLLPGQAWTLTRNTRVKLARAPLLVELSGRHVEAVSE